MSWETKVAKMCRTVLDLRCDDDSPFRLTEYYIMETFKINYAYNIGKSKIIGIVNACHNDAFDGSRKDEINTAFRRLVRYGFLRSNMSGGTWNSPGKRERHYEIAFGKKGKAKRKAMLKVNSDNQSAAA